MINFAEGLDPRLIAMQYKVHQGLKTKFIHPREKRLNAIKNCI